MKLSVITINFNNAKGLQETFKSIVSQTFKDFEYIVIDGGSADGSTAIIDQHKEQISYWVSEPDKGIYNAMNKGLERSTGDYLMFLNSGDTLYSNDTLKQVVRHLDGTDIIYGSFVMLYPGGKKLLEKNDRDISLITFLERERHLCHQSVFMSKRSILKAGKFDESLKVVADWKLFCIALFKQEASFKFIDETISFFETGGISLRLESFEMIQKERDKVLEEDFPLVYKDFLRAKKIGCTFSEIFNSPYIRRLLQIRKRLVRLFK